MTQKDEVTMDEKERKPRSGSGEFQEHEDHQTTLEIEQLKLEQQKIEQQDSQAKKNEE